jgi:hypothetical protein
MRGLSKLKTSGLFSYDKWGTIGRLGEDIEVRGLSKNSHHKMPQFRQKQLKAIDGISYCRRGLS